MTAVLGVYFSSRAWFRVGYERQSFQDDITPSISGVRSMLARQLLVDEDTSMRNTLRITAALVGLTMATRRPAAAQSLTGAGATFPNPIYTKWFDAYNKKTGVQINYQSIGSGGGIRQFTEGTVDFGASDGPMNESQIAAVNGNVLHVPTVLGAVVRDLQPARAGRDQAQVRRQRAGRHLHGPDHQVERPASLPR